VCEGCEDTGWIITEGIARRCSRCERDLQKKLLQQLSNPPTSGADFTSFNDLYRRAKPVIQGNGSELVQFRLLVQALINFAKEPKGWIAVSGRPGSLKTSLLVLLTKAVPTAVYCYVPDLVSRMFRSLSSRDETDLLAIKEGFVNAPVVLFDDLGASSETSEWIVGQLTHVFDTRYRYGLPTVTTTNLTAQQLDIRFPRIASRLFDVNAGHLFFPLALKQDLRSVEMPK